MNITMSDTGEIVFSNSAPNLTPIDVERLFDRFYTVQNGKGGTGLGLSISKALITQMGGSISAEYYDGSLIMSVKL